MRRRDLIRLFGGFAIASQSGRIADADQKGRIAILSSAREETAEAAFRKRLDQLGWHEGSNLAIAIRYADSGLDQARTYANELVAMKPDAVFATNTQMVRLLQIQTTVIPIIFVQVPDPIGSDFVKSFANPGGNITGFTNFDPSMGGKWVEYLKDAVPNVERIGVILEAGNPTASGYLKAISSAALSVSLPTTPLSVRDGETIERAIAGFAREENGALIVPPSALAAIFRARLIELCAKYHIPAMYPYSEYATFGGLMAYGVNRDVLYEQAASYVDMILRGKRPTDLPVQTPSKFELFVNLKSARTLGLTVTRDFLSLADEVIE